MQPTSSFPSESMSSPEKSSSLRFRGTLLLIAGAVLAAATPALAQRRASRPAPRPALELTWPTARTVWRMRDPLQVKWRAARDIRFVRVIYSGDNGATWRDVTGGQKIAAATGVLALPAIANKKHLTNHALFRVIDLDNPSVFVTSEPFRIIGNDEKDATPNIQRGDRFEDDNRDKNARRLMSGECQVRSLAPAGDIDNIRVPIAEAGRYKLRFTEVTAPLRVEIFPLARHRGRRTPPMISRIIPRGKQSLKMVVGPGMEGFRLRVTAVTPRPTWYRVSLELAGNKHDKHRHPVAPPVFVPNVDYVNISTQAPMIKGIEGRTLKDVDLKKGRVLYYRIDVPRNAANMRIYTWGGKGDPNLYLDRGCLPDHNSKWQSTGSGRRENIVIANPPAGTYYLKMHAKGKVEEVNLTVVIKQGTHRPPVVPPVLVPNVDVMNLGSQNRTIKDVKLKKGKALYYRIDVPRGAQNLQITTWGGEGNPNLYLDRGRLPEHNARWQSAGSGRGEQITLHNPPAGTYYLQMYAKGKVEEVNLTVTIKR